MDQNEVPVQSTPLYSPVKEKVYSLSVRGFPYQDIIKTHTFLYCRITLMKLLLEATRNEMGRFFKSKEEIIAVI